MDQPVNPGADAASSSNVVDYAVFASRRQAKLVASGFIVAEPGPSAQGNEAMSRRELFLVEDLVRHEAPESTPTGDDPARA